MSQQSSPQQSSSMSTLLVPMVVFAVVFFGWQAFGPKPAETPLVNNKTQSQGKGQKSVENEGDKEGGSEGSQKPADSQNPQGLKAPDTDKSPSTPVIQLEETTFDFKDKRKVVFSNKGACIKYVELYQNDNYGIHSKPFILLDKTAAKQPHYGLSIGGNEDLNNVNWKIESQTKNSIVYSTTTDAGITITKSFELDGHYVIKQNVTLKAAAGLKDKAIKLYGATNIQFGVDQTNELTYAGTYFIGKRNDNAYMKTMTFVDLQDNDEDAKEDKDEYSYKSNSSDGLGDENKLVVMGMASQYFTVMSRAPKGATGEFVHAKSHEDTKFSSLNNGLSFYKFTVDDDTEFSVDVRHYLGPLQEKALVDSEMGKSSLLALQKDGFMSGLTKPIESLLLWVLQKIYSWMTGSYGWAIIILTIMVRICIHPLTRFAQTKMQDSQEKMAIIQPKLDKLKEKYKNDQQAYAKAQMELMKEHGAMGGMCLGCLPMVLQFPIYIALFNMLRSYIEFRGSTFGYIKDLSLPDQLLPLSGVIGMDVNLLPFMTLAVTMISMRRNLKRTQDANKGRKLTPEQEMQQKMQQKMMTYLMPPFLFFITYGFSSGLLLYWFTSGLIGTLEAEYIRKRRDKMMAAK